MQTATDIGPFTPKALYYADADSLEYVRVDAPVIYRRIDDLLTLVLSIEDREPVGFMIKGFQNFYIRRLKSQKNADDETFLRMVTVLEKIMTEIGEALFIEGPRRAAYKAATNIAMEDQVILAELPHAA